MQKRSLVTQVFLLSTVAALFLWFGCTDNTLVTDLPSEAVLSPETNPEVARTISVRKRADDDLLMREGVEGVGTRILPDGSTAIVVYTRAEGVASKADLPAQIDDIPVVTVVTGVFRARSDETSKARPAPIGFSVGHPNITAGTIGARVRDASGNVFVLSNNHVLADNNAASIGDNTLQPGPYDGGSDPADAIGTLYDYEPIDFSNNNSMDAAISVTSTSNVDYKTPSDEGYGVPGTTVVSASIGQSVQKYGRTTGHTSGEVAEVDVTVDVCYECSGPFCFSCSKSARFVNQIGITPGEFSAGGDSGSLIVTNDNDNNPVGLLFAGSDTRTLANPIGAVLARFDVSIDDGSSGDGGGDSENAPPSASFTFSCTDLSCSFDAGGSSDSDGSIAGYDWTLGDGSTASGSTVSHTYDADGDYLVTLTVTDDDGATDSQSQTVSVSSSSSSDFTLTASGYKVRGLQKADLSWSGATSTSVDVLRNGSVVATTANDGAYTDDINNRGGGSYSYKVCEAGTSTCSNETTVTF